MLSITWAGAASGWAALPPGSAIAYQDGFEATLVGSGPAGWSVFSSDPPNANYLVTNNIAAQGSQSLHIFDNSTLSSLFATHPLSTVITPDMTTTLSVDWFYASDNGSDNFVVHIGSADGAARFVLAPTAIYQWYLGGSGQFFQIATPTTDTWYQADMILHPSFGLSTGVYDLVVTRLSDNTQIASVTNLYYLPPSTGWNSLALGENSAVSAVGDNLFLDNFTVSAIPEPSSTLCGLLGGLGLWGLWRRRK